VLDLVEIHEKQRKMSVKSLPKFYRASVQVLSKYEFIIFTKTLYHSPSEMYLQMQLLAFSGSTNKQADLIFTKPGHDTLPSDMLQFVENITLGLYGNSSLFSFEQPLRKMTPFIQTHKFLVQIVSVHTDTYD